MMNQHIFSHIRIALIGAGHMGSALLGGLIQNGFSPQNIFISDPDLDKLNRLHQKYSVQIETHNDRVIKNAEIIIIAVKPQQLESVIKPLASLIKKNQPLVISIVAGMRSQQVLKWIGSTIPLVRCMPNTPALIGAGMTGLYANEAVALKQRNLAESILRAVGEIIWLEDEKLMDAVTALSGSGPAYFFLVMEALQKAGEKMGLSEDVAFLLTVQTALGAARIALEQDLSLSELKKRVTSPGGTTEAALHVLERGKLVDLFQEAIFAARRRATELGVLKNE